MDLPSRSSPLIRIAGSSAIADVDDRERSSERSGLSPLAQSCTPTPRQDEARKCDPLLKEEPGHEIERSTERLRWHWFQTVTTPLQRDGHNDTRDGKE